MNKKMKEACAAVADVFEAIPEAWTSGAYGRDEYGEIVWGDDGSACKWCSIGGMMAATNRDDGKKMLNALRPFSAKLGYNTPLDANDSGGRLVAIKMLRLAAQS